MYRARRNASSIRNNDVGLVVFLLHMRFARPVHAVAVSISPAKALSSPLYHEVQRRFNTLIIQGSLIIMTLSLMADDLITFSIGLMMFN